MTQNLRQDCDAKRQGNQQPKRIAPEHNAAAPECGSTVTLRGAM